MSRTFRATRFLVPFALLCLAGSARAQSPVTISGQIADSTSKRPLVGAEITVLQAFLPQAATPEEVQAAVDAAVAEVSAQGVSGAPAMGRVMALVKQTLAGRADMTEVSKAVKARLA